MKAVAVRVVDVGQPRILLLILLRVYNGLNDNRITL